MDTIPSHAIKLGEGALSWNSLERRGGRYGTVMFCAASSIEVPLGPYNLDESQVASLVGHAGTLAVRVVETRESSHVGDLFMKIAPRVPQVGQVITLGNGKLFVDGSSAEWEGCSTSVGVEPSSERLEGEGSFPFTFGMSSVENDPAPVPGTTAMQFREESQGPPWMDVRALYDAHEQTVELYFIPEAVA